MSLERSEHCDINGLICLNAHYAELSVLKKKNSNRLGLECYCLASCIEAEIDVITVETFMWVKDKHKIFQLKRNIVI